MTTHDDASGPDIDFVLLTAPALTALLAGELSGASEAAGVALPPAFLDDSWLWRYRLRQVERDPASAPWLVRAVVARPEGIVVGHAGFHGPPDERGMVEIGYSILPEHRRRGYGRAVARALIREAEEAPEVRVVRASISPDNVASLALVRPLGFAQVGEQWDEIDGLELVFERPVRDETT